MISSWLSNRRRRLYHQALLAAQNGKYTKQCLVKLGYKLFWQHGLHHHFWADYKLKTQAQVLVTYAEAQLAKLMLATKDQSQTDALKVAPALASVDLVKLSCQLFERRISERLPLAYLVNYASYCGHEFYVTPDVLVPRSLMSNRFKQFLALIQWSNYRVLDLCTGSGCIGISLALLDERLKVDLTDISSKALDVANINIQRFKLEQRVRSYQGDLFSALDNVKLQQQQKQQDWQELQQHKYDLIITNPPYVSELDYNAAPAEFHNEPKLAIIAKANGLELIQNILSHAAKYLTDNGVLIAEVGFATAKLLKKQYPKHRFKWFKYLKANGKEPWFGPEGVFMCKREDLL